MFPSKIIARIRNHISYSISKSRNMRHTWIRPFTRHTLCFKTTICGSSGCIECNSCLTDSKHALCSADSWMARTSPVALTSLPKTARESPRLATYRIPLQITATRQQDPTAAICGFIGHCFATTEQNPSSVAWNAFRITSTDIQFCSAANPTKVAD